MISGIQHTGQAGVVIRSSARPKVDLKSSRPARRKDDQADTALERKQPEVVRTGFGKGTISPPAAALRTLGKGLQSARRIVPTAEELREDLRASAAERRESQAQQVQERQSRPNEAQSPDAVRQARSLIQAMNQAAGMAQARVAEETPAANSPGSTIEINGRALNYVRPQSEDTAASTPPKLNVLV